MQIQPRQKLDLRQGDQRWLGNGGRPAQVPAPIVLDRSAFMSAYPNGFIPSGVPLGQIAANGLYGPYGGNTSEVQTVGLGSASAGTVTIGFDGETTASIAFNANAATVQAAVDALSNVNAGDIVVTGGPFPGVMTFTFGGQRAGDNVPALVVTPTGLTGGTVAVNTTTPGGSVSSDGTQHGAGLLFADVPYDRNGAAGDEVGGALFFAGEVYEEHLPVAIDDDFRDALKLVRFVPAPA